MKLIKVPTMSGEDYWINPECVERVVTNHEISRVHDRERCYIMFSNPNTVPLHIDAPMKEVIRLLTGVTIRQYRDSRGLTQERMAELLGVSKSYYIKVESGHCKAGRGFIQKLYKVFPEVNWDLKELI